MDPIKVNLHLQLLSMAFPQLNVFSSILCCHLNSQFYRKLPLWRKCYNFQRSGVRKHFKAIDPKENEIGRHPRVRTAAEAAAVLLPQRFSRWTQERETNGKKTWGEKGQHQKAPKHQFYTK